MLGNQDYFQDSCTGNNRNPSSLLRPQDACRIVVISELTCPPNVLLLTSEQHPAFDDDLCILHVGILPPSLVPLSDTIDAADDLITVNVTARACTEIMPKPQPPTRRASRIFEIVLTSNPPPRARHDVRPYDM